MDPSIKIALLVFGLLVIIGLIVFIILYFGTSTFEASDSSSIKTIKLLIKTQLKLHRLMLRLQVKIHQEIIALLLQLQIS